MPTDTFYPEMDQTMNTADATTTHTTTDIVLTTERYNHNRTITMIHDTLQEHCFLLSFFYSCSTRSSNEQEGYCHQIPIQIPRTHVCTLNKLS